MAGFTGAQDSIGTVLISTELGAPGAEPGAIRSFWARRSERATANGTAAQRAVENLAGLKFGNFTPRRIDQYVYAGSAINRTPSSLTGTADTTYRQVPRGRVEVRGDVFTVNDSNYMRPPIGYYYKAWGIKVGEFDVFADTVSLGDKASPYPRRISFKDADVSVPDPISMFVSETPCAPGATECKVQQPVIWASQHRVLASSLGIQRVGQYAWKDFSWAYITLQSKASPDDLMGGVVIMNVNLPGSISGR